MTNTKAFKKYPSSCVEASTETTLEIQNDLVSAVEAVVQAVLDDRNLDQWRFDISVEPVGRRSSNRSVLVKIWLINLDYPSWLPKSIPVRVHLNSDTMLSQDDKDDIFEDVNEFLDILLDKMNNRS